MEHQVLVKQLEPVKELMEDVRRKALMRLEYEGLDKGRPDPASYAMDRYAYYVCFKCKKVLIALHLPTYRSFFDILSKGKGGIIAIVANLHRKYLFLRSPPGSEKKK